MYQLVVELTVLVHFTFICYVVGGGFLALRWRRTIWLHVAAVIWGVAITIGHLPCPLTGLERWGRAKAGMPGLPSKGFIDHYITGVVYPVGWLGAAHAFVFGTVALSWALYVWRGRHRDSSVCHANLEARDNVQR